MDAWWSYRPSDLLMFSPSIYWRLFESLNRQAWPFGLALLVAGVWVAVGWARGARRRQKGAARGVRVAERGVCLKENPPNQTGSARSAVVLMALAWLVVAGAFFWQRLAPISTAAETFAGLFVVQAVGLACLAVSPGLRWASARPARTRAGWALGAWALVGHPALAWVFGRPGSQAEWLGLAPDPTAMGALALLLLLDSPRDWPRVLWRVLWIVPLVWCAITGLTLWTLGEAGQAAVLLALVSVALGALALGRR